MPRYLPIGLGAGLASAVLFASAAGGVMSLRILLLTLAPLPMLLAGLGWGWTAGLVAGLVGSALVAIVASPWVGLVYALTHALPVVTLTYLAGLSRPVPSPDPSRAAGQEWYPVGRMVLLTAITAGALSLVSLLAIGVDVDTLRKRLRPMVETMVTTQFPGVGGRQLSASDIDTMTETVLFIMPAASAILWMSGLLFNLWLAGRITLASGNLLRPWPDIPSMSFPPGSPLLLAAATAGTFLDGVPGLIASSFAGAFYLAYVLLGLAVVHAVTRGVVWRPFILFACYTGLLILNTWMSLLFAMIGLVEPWAPWRRNNVPGGGSGGGGGTGGHPGGPGPGPPT